MVDEAHAIQFQHSLKLCEVFGEFSDTEVNHGIPAVEKRDGSGRNRNRTVSIDQALHVQTPGKPLAALLNRSRRHIGQISFPEISAKRSAIRPRPHAKSNTTERSGL